MRHCLQKDLQKEWENWKWVFGVRNRSVQDGCFAGSAENDESDFGAGQVSQLTSCSQTRHSSCSCSARAEYKENITAEGDGVSKERFMRER